MQVLKPGLLVVAGLLVLAMALLYEGDIPRDVVDAKYMNHASQFLTMDSGARIHFRDEGNRAGTPLVLVHGANASLHTWEPWVKILGEDFRIITLDLPAHGLTGAVPDGRYDTSRYIEVVSAVVDHLGIEKFVLGGNSMGGGVSWRYALTNPERVQSLLLINSVGLRQWFRPSGDDQSRPLAFTLLSKPWFRAIARHLDPYLLVEQGLMSAYNQSPVVTDELITRYSELTLRDGTRGAILARAGRKREEATPDLTQLAMPTLIMWGEEDALINVKVAHRFHEVLPNSMQVIYKDVGHVPMEEIPDRSAEDVRQYLAGLNLTAE